ncbi:MAG: DegT/DnrJ/EryC1/StrS family aminotransferase [Bacteroidetes bacterium]|nr:DegT/DnrJ/EryC1/StrS family aminotransferase [Bacteroidota bacterium]
MINVTKITLPPLDEYYEYLKGIWERSWVTNQGPLVNELEEKLKVFFDVKHLFFVANGTIALQIAIKSLNKTGEIITTPFSYVATTSSIVWEGSKAVFVDIDPETLNIDPEKIENAITKDTIAILPTHVFGNPCNNSIIENIAKKHNLKVIYDAAHSFGVKYNDLSISKLGDISTYSFHATKIFHTIEGGAIATNDDTLAHTISYMRNFGHNGQEDFFGLGINGKNCEFHAAMGLCMLPNLKKSIEKRKNLTNSYDNALIAINKDLKRIKIDKNVEYNYSYYPIIFKNEEDLLKVKSALNNKNIFPRRYFYPSLNKLNYVNNYSMPVSESISKRILCLPLFDDLTESEQLQIINIILNKI